MSVWRRKGLANGYIQPGGNNYKFGESQMICQTLLLWYKERKFGDVLI